MITPEMHLARILAAVRPMPTVSVDLRAGADGVCGRVLAQGTRAQVPLPGFTNSAMDGYAVRAADVVEPGVTLPVLGDVPAGDTRELTLTERAAWRIMTGAAVPAGADAVIPVEQSDGGTQLVTFAQPAVPGKHIRRAGEDVTVGDLILPSGTVLAPHHIAVLASAGVADVEVRQRPRVAVISTGDELRPAGERLEHGQIHDSNGPMLAALVRAAGAEVHSVRHLVDDESAVSEALAEIVETADLVITTGGVSAGAFDVVKSALIAAGDVTFDRVSMQPGKPQGFGLLGKRQIPVFTLPGNPMSTLVSFHVFVLPALASMSGMKARRLLRGVVATGWKPPADRTQYARVDVISGDDGSLLIQPNVRQGSHHLGELSTASALAVVPAEVEQVEPGDVLDVMELLEGKYAWA